MCLTLCPLPVYLFRLSLSPFPLSLLSLSLSLLACLVFAWPSVRAQLASVAVAGSTCCNWLTHAHPINTHTHTHTVTGLAWAREKAELSQRRQSPSPSPLLPPLGHLLRLQLCFQLQLPFGVSQSLASLATLSGATHEGQALGKRGSGVKGSALAPLGPVSLVIIIFQPTQNVAAGTQGRKMAAASSSSSSSFGAAATRNFCCCC